MIPDGILVKVISFGMRKFVGRIPKDKREEYWEKGMDALAKIVAAGAEGAVRGGAAKIKYKF